MQRNRKYGKCKVILDGIDVPACQITVERDMTVTIPQKSGLNVLQSGIETARKRNPPKLLAFDIGTTSVVCFLLDGKTGKELAKSSMLNPQTAFGADVISRIQAALQGALEQETKVIRDGMVQLVQELTGKIKFLELASLPEFSRTFAKSMNFREKPK